MGTSMVVAPERFPGRGEEEQTEDEERFHPFSAHSDALGQEAVQSQYRQRHPEDQSARARARRACFVAALQIGDYIAQCCVKRQQRRR